MSNADQKETAIPEDRLDEQRIANPVEDAERATRRMKEQERTHKPIYPQPGDAERQGGESSPAPDKRRA